MACSDALSQLQKYSILTKCATQVMEIMNNFIDKCVVVLLKLTIFAHNKTN